MFKKGECFLLIVKSTGSAHIEIELSTRSIGSLELGLFLQSSKALVQYFKSFYHQLMHKIMDLKGVLKFTLKQLQHVAV
jgi:hypothetical protein